ncbi:hypothetical protein [Jiangella gansuensis]|uniref:hypothetical protein n=1 Tax=Jiangella gansuensis TaxID=281473 RepID=UPI0004B01AAE|nr:hypothetical protein [Jiangella gansuensis]
MATTISNGTSAVVPLLVLGWAPVRPSRAVVHRLIGDVFAAVTLRPQAAREGTLRLLCADEAAAQAAVDLHSQGVVLTITDGDVAAVSMTYVVTGNVASELDPQTLRRWLVSVDYTEVAP